MPPQPVNGDSFTFLYVYDVRTSQEAHASTACYRDSFAFLYVDDVRTSQATHVWPSMACYRDSFALLYFTSFYHYSCYPQTSIPRFWLTESKEHHVNLRYKTNMLSLWYLSQ
jgi:hypothetical protein